MVVVLAVLAWVVVLAGGWAIWTITQLLQLRPGVFGAEALAVLLALWLTVEARRCG